LKQFLLFTITTLLPVQSFAQIYQNSFTGASACPTAGNVPVMDPNATGTAATRSTMTCTMFANAFNSTTLNNTAAVNDNSYIEFSVTAVPGYQLNLTSLSFFRQGSATAPNQLEIRYSTDGFVTSTNWGGSTQYNHNTGCNNGLGFRRLFRRTGRDRNFQNLPLRHPAVRPWNRQSLYRRYHKTRQCYYKRNREQSNAGQINFV
jgi:hypothetical protein